MIAKSNSNIHAGDIVKKAAFACGGKGGGNPTFAQGGGNDATDIDKVLEDIKKDIKHNE